MKGTDEMTNMRESNPKFPRTRLAITAAILTVGIAGLTSGPCHNHSWATLAVPAARAGLILQDDGDRSWANPTTSKERSVTDASVMWGSFASPATCGERACGSPRLPASRVAV